MWGFFCFDALNIKVVVEVWLQKLLQTLKKWIKVNKDKRLCLIDI
jgi:hypothetical protein